MELLAVITTVANDEQAATLAQRAVEARCAACVHQDTIMSTYHWQGAVQHEAEVRLTFKTTAAAYGALEALIRQHHPYELPAIYAVPVARASAAYAAWVAEQTQTPA